MRIVVNGQQAFGKAVLDALVERGEDVIAAYCSPDKAGGRVDPLKEAALGHGIDVYQPASFKPAPVLEDFKALKPDLCVMAYVIALVPEEFLDAPTRGSIQYHPSLLPKHRGPSSINWPIIQGETKTGLTIFWPDKGLDTGPVLLRKEVAIGPDDTLGSLYFDQLYPLGVSAMLEAVDLVKAGEAPHIAQDESQASYEGWCRTEDVAIDWWKPASDIYNTIRGANPQPGAWTRCAGQTVQVFDAARIEGDGGAPGEVVAVGDEGVTVAARGGRVLIKRVRPEGEGKIPAAEFAATAGVRPGSRLG